jgi:hypothetical protein
MGVYDQTWQQEPVSDKSPRSSLKRIEGNGGNVFAEINRRNREFWGCQTRHS